MNMTRNWDTYVAIEAEQSMQVISRNIKDVEKAQASIDARMAALEARLAQVEALMAVTKPPSSVPIETRIHNATAAEITNPVEVAAHYGKLYVILPGYC
jgi:uncharacterized protein YjcR